MPLYIPDIPLVDFTVQEKVSRNLERRGLAGQIGALEPLLLRLAAIRGQTLLTFPRKTVILLAADHGHRWGNPRKTAADLALAASGRAPISALARQAGVEITLADVGLVDSKKLPGVQHLPAGRGTNDWHSAPSLTLPQVQDALMIGMNLTSIEISRGLDLLAIGEIASGGKLAAAAAVHLAGEVPLADLGLSEEETGFIRIAVDVHRPDSRDPLDILRTVGGIELAGLTGVILAAAAGRVPVVLDGVVSATAGLLASYLNPAVRAYLIAGHRSGEPAHDITLRKLGLRPLLSLGLTISAGSGAVIALHLIEAAARLLSETAVSVDDDIQL